jgi:hypothetical protein
VEAYLRVYERKTYDEAMAGVKAILKPLMKIRAEMRFVLQAKLTIAMWQKFGTMWQRLSASG